MADDGLDRRRWVYLGDNALEAVAYSLEGDPPSDDTKARVLLTIAEVDVSGTEANLATLIVDRYAQHTGTILDRTMVADGLRILGVVV